MSPGKTTREVLWVLVALLAGLWGVAATLPVLGLAGGVPVAAAVLFVALPVLVLDRSDRPYARYGMIWRPRRWAGDIGIALAAATVTFPPVVAAVAMFPQIWGASAFGWHWRPVANWPAWVLAHFALVAFPEEFFFRGYLLGRLGDRWPPRRRVLGAPMGRDAVVTAALFAVSHLIVDGRPARLLVFFPALVFAWLQRTRNSLAAPVAYHGLSNLFMDTLIRGFGT